jgi:hypothetical protein
MQLPIKGSARAAMRRTSDGIAVHHSIARRKLQPIIKSFRMVDLQLWRKLAIRRRIAAIGDAEDFSTPRIAWRDHPEA